MISVKTQGRLGNQIFQYCFAYYLSKKLKTPFYITRNNQLNKYFKLRKFEKLQTKIYRKLFSNKITKSISESELKQISIQNNCIYSGFFQTDKYFMSYENKLRKLLQIKPSFITDYKLKYPQYINEKTIVMHFRGSDYFNWKGGNLGTRSPVLPIKYYKNALELFNCKEYKLVFISDSINYVQEKMQRDDIEYINDSVINDFLCIYFANVAIISNSSFSYWAAMLNKIRNKRIIAPKYWLGHYNNKTYPPEIETTQFEWISTL